MDGWMDGTIEEKLGRGENRREGGRGAKERKGRRTLIDFLVHASAAAALILVPSAARHVFHGVLFDVVHCELV